MGKTLYHGASSDDADVLCVVVHGRGQTQQDMMTSIVDRLDVDGVRFALPKSQDAGWYEARAIDPLTQATRAQMGAGVAQICALVRAEKASAPKCALLLCGFSQGACMAMEILMCQPGIADAACLLTACRVGAETDALPIGPLGGLPVYASCGDDDPWIPAPAHYRMLGDLTRAGARIRADMFPGRPHEVADTEIGVVADMLRALGAKRPPFTGAVA